MMRTMSETSGADKHHDSIIQSAKTRRVRRPGSRRQLRIVVYIFLIVIAAVVVGYFLLRPGEESFTLRSYTSTLVEVRTIRDYLQLGGTVRARREATIRAPVTGILQSLDVDVGSWVVPGQVVAVLDAEDLRNAIEAQKQNLTQNSRAYESMLLSREQAVLISDRTREILKKSLENALEILANAQELHKLGTITSAALREAENQVADARAAIEDHDEDQDIAARFHELSRLDSEDNLEQIRKSISDLDEQLRETDIASSIEGRVVWTIDTITAVGNSINQNAPIIQVADTNDPFVEAAIEEQYVDDIAIGQEVAIIISGQRFTGSVERIGLLAAIPPEGGPPQVDLDLRVEVENFEALPGGTALAELVVGVVPDALVLPRGPYLSTGSQQFLYRIEGSTAVRTHATFGAITENQVEILSGVSDGEEIITSSYQNYIDFGVIKLGGRE